MSGNSNYEYFFNLNVQTVSNMKKLLTLKPVIHLIGFFIGMIGLFFLSSLIICIVPGKIFLNLILPLLAWILPVLFWIYYVGYALDITDKCKNNKRGFKKYILSILLILLGYSLTTANAYYFIEVHHWTMPVYYDVLLSLIMLYGFFYIINYIVKRFALYYSKRNVKIIDYLGYLMLLCIFPVGIVIIQAQIRTMVKENNVQ